MRKKLCYAVITLLLAGCTKNSDQLIEKTNSKQVAVPPFQTYLIKQGQHYADHNDYTPIETSKLKFSVKFDSSAIYTSNTEENQYDINKLYGFSDNNAFHHQYSARFGWSWTEDALHLYAYVYNEGVVVKEDLGTVTLNAEIVCSIEVADTVYKFQVNDKVLSVPRKSTTPKARGYKLYPYFGGDETAPHDIIIQIKNL